MTEIIYAIDIMTIIYVIITIPIVVFLISVVYHYTQVLIYQNVSKKLKKYAGERLAIELYNEVLEENIKLKERIKELEEEKKKLKLNR